MDLGLSDKAALITGAGSGIGRACARALADEGARVGLIDRNLEGLEMLRGELLAAGSEVSVFQADVTDEHAIADAVDAFAAQNGSIDVVVGCAGTSGPFGSDLLDITLADWNAVMAVNVTGQFLLTRAALPHLRRAADPSVVFIASDSAFVTAPGMVPYCASKGAVVQLAKALSVDLAPDGIRVNCVCPSIVDTAMSRADLGIGVEGFAGAGYPVQSADDVARHVLYLVSPRSKSINAHALVSDFGYLARSSFPA
ncbi:MAG: SDR family oxidoreductase [Pseudolysinimonas sp.]